MVNLVENTLVATKYNKKYNVLVYMFVFWCFVTLDMQDIQSIVTCMASVSFTTHPNQSATAVCTE